MGKLGVRFAPPIAALPADAAKIAQIAIRATGESQAQKRSKQSQAWERRTPRCVRSFDLSIFPTPPRCTEKRSRNHERFPLSSVRRSVVYRPAVHGQRL